MQPWFMWNGVDSRTMGLWVTELPAPTRPAERVQEVQIPGRAGTLTLKEGTDVHDGYVKECIVTVPSGIYFEGRFDWLKGDGEVVFSNEEDRVYHAHLAGEIKFDKISNSLKQATIPFYVMPHKGQYPPESDTVINTSGTLYNPGNVGSKPIITLTFTLACNLVVNGTMMAFVHDGSTASETITVDCDTWIVLKDGELWDGKVYGDFPKLTPGMNTITIQVPEIYETTGDYQLWQITRFEPVTELRMIVPIGTGDHGTNLRWLTVGTYGTVAVGSDIVVRPRWRWC